MRATWKSPGVFPARVEMTDDSGLVHVLSVEVARRVAQELMLAATIAASINRQRAEPVS